MADPERAVDILRRMRALGVRLSIDDYGTGYSSLAYLQRLHVDELKLDQSFIARLTTDPSSEEIVRSTIDLGHNLGLKIVAEGVGDETTWDILASMGCDVGQGYFVARPMPADDLRLWLARPGTQGPTA